MMKLKTLWLKITLWAVLIHIILIIISFLEVLIYSILVNPAQEHGVYEKHAELSAPYISILFGFILFFLITRFLCQRNIERRMSIVLLLPIIYTIIDFLMLQFSGVNWEEHYLIFIVSFVFKFFGAYLGGASAKKNIQS